MSINIIVKRGWILERMALEVSKALPGVTINCGQTERAVDPTAAINYFMPAKDLIKYPTPTYAVGLFTHGSLVPEVLTQFTACVSMNRQVAAQLSKLTKADIVVIRPGTDTPARPPVFGVVGRPYNSGRKGEAMVEQAVSEGFQFVACAPRAKVRATRGARWPCKVTHRTEHREEFYRTIDYLVVPSLEEGGPIPVLEALAHHVPVIAPNVGWCWEFPVIRYERGSWESLKGVLEGLARPPSWAEWAERHRRLFRRLLKEKAA